jgi:hypothetical protein
VAVPAFPGRGEVRRRDPEVTLESVRELLDRLLIGVTDEGWRDVDPDVVRDCMGAPREFRSIAIRVAILVDRVRAQEAGGEEEDLPEEE